MTDPSGDSKELWKGLEKGIECDPVELGRYTSDDYRTDPKHISFVAARYKFVARMFDGCGTVIEVGCGDGFGAPFVASVVERLICTDINEPMLEDNRRRLDFLGNVSFGYADFRAKAHSPEVDAIYLVDVLEHIFPEEEEAFMRNLAGSLREHGVMLIGTPNKTADQYASKWSRQGHVNLKTSADLQELGLSYFHNVFRFGMNDEVVHTGYPAMCHFLWALLVAPRR